MPADGVSERDLSRCFGKHRQQPVQYALQHCLQCRKLKGCVRKSWGTDRQRPWRKDDWWQTKTTIPVVSQRPPRPSTPTAAS
jgi:hypothetical protein